VVVPFHIREDRERKRRSASGDVYVSSTYSGTKERLTAGCSLPGREYAKADFRWGTADPTVVSLEILTVLGAGPLCCYIINQLIRNDPARHYWIIVLSTAELYGG